MYSVSIHHPVGHWPGDKAVGSLTLDFEKRHRRRILLTTDQGENVLLNLPQAVAMADGDALQLEDGRLLKVRAAAEFVVEVRHRELVRLMRLAWHLGNRHLPTEIHDHALRIRPDHVIEEMLSRYGAELIKMKTPFQPEGGAYGGHTHDYIHNHAHDVQDSDHHHD
jgi:urease accessory protein